ncbi:MULTISPECIES: hypothetical protein [Mycobacteriaceae]|uniref:Uncharacterized protein n=1 Tax=Mycolicibacterium parafortuitum TaxID=39692 RepID=A0ACC6MNR2_MYCPF|nr:MULTISPECIES: hypothetical protein [Mycobacteriaceae]MDZ5088650.1 hypothetical protein [Mycolicibacterium parafortuitum]MEC9326012.1 hypothetical protein [Actinomycetota bacterium]GFM21290.1 putative uncharacterized protein [Mycobacterium sp. PO1]GFM25045.1 putative uncharacterized protein [Mycobacterium sp. PO2]
MKLSTVTAVSAICFGCTLGLSAPAWSDGPVFNGTFRFVSDDGSTSTWVVTPCGTGCAHVVSDTGYVNVDAQLVDGQWRFTYTHPAAWDCEDGTDAPGTRHVTLDAATLRGTVAQGPDMVCGETDVVEEAYGFALNQIG